MWWWSNRPHVSAGSRVGYKEAAVQSFTAASNNFVSDEDTRSSKPPSLFALCGVAYKGAKC
jgi:hypothetical protein